MRQSIKSVCILIGAIAFIVTLLFWLLDRPDSAVWTTRIVAPIVTAVAVGIIVFLNSKKDLAPDFLSEKFETFFNQNGFCFAFSTSVKDGIAYIEAYYQNQYANPCVGQIALLPARGFWMNRADVVTITFEIKCESGEFGCCRIPVAIPVELQGQNQRFDVNASVTFPDGTGKRLRFSDGTSGATTTLSLPNNVSNADVREDAETETIWEAGDEFDQVRV
ncbi:hypothetical protein N9Y42_00330 [Mariniblastus sp.]|nr:hypothetical protein [Mariniblastus sp.]